MAVLHRFYCILSDHETVYALSDTGTELLFEIELQPFAIRSLKAELCFFGVFFCSFFFVFFLEGGGGANENYQKMPQSQITSNSRHRAEETIIIEPRHAISNNMAIG